MPSTKDTILAVAKQDLAPELVRINDDAIAHIDGSQIKGNPAEGFAKENNGTSLEEATRFAIALNSINYQFWEVKTGEFVRYQHNGKVGALAMREGFEAAWFNQDKPWARLQQPLTELDVIEAFGAIPNVASRVEILNEVLLSKELPVIAKGLSDYIEAEKDTALLTTEHAARLAEAFPRTYADPLLKKAQLAISEVWVEARHRGYNVKTELTAFADYQIPRILRAMNILQYDAKLAEKVDTQQLITPNSPEEKAIRAASILAIEMLSQRHGVSSAAIDHFLWSRRNEAKEPFHLCETTLY